MTTRNEQLSRASVAAAFAVVTAAVSHTVAGGAAPSVIAVTLSFLVATIVSIPLVGKSASLVRIGITVFVGQMVLHGLYAMFPASAAVSSTASVGMHDHSMSLMPLPDTLNSASSAPAFWMTVAHVVAGVLAIVVLRHADVALAVVRTARSFVLAIFTLPSAPAILPQFVRIAASATQPQIPSRVFLSVVQKRGPPRRA